MKQNVAVWKIGSHWGNQGESVLDLFLNYECVFFGACNGNGIGNWSSVKSGDFFIISDGKTPVAIGKSTGVFRNYEQSKFSFTKKHRDEFIDADVRLCPASIVLLPENLRDKFSIDPQKRFCRCSYNEEKEQQVMSAWQEIYEIQHKKFEIIPRTVSLFGQDGIFLNTVFYRVPKYQRPYSWGENELRRLIESLREAVQTDDAVFMGTMQLSAPIPLSTDGLRVAYNIIDGQQRITTFILLQNLLEQMLNIPHTIDGAKLLQTWVSRGEEQLKWEEYLHFVSSMEETTAEKLNLNRYLQNHIGPSGIFVGNHYSTLFIPNLAII